MNHNDNTPEMSQDIEIREFFKEAIQKDDADQMRTLIQSRDANIINMQIGKNKETLLHFAAESGSKNIAKFLFNEGVDLNSLNALDQTPLHCAIINNKTEVAVFLIKKGANLNLPDKNNMSPISLAFEGGNDQIVERLLGAGAELDIDIPPIPEATECDAGLVTNYLIQSEWKIDESKLKGNELHVLAGAELRCYKPTFLTKNNEAVDLEEDFWSAPLFDKQYLLPVVMALLIEKCPTEVNLRDLGSNTPLHVAAYSGESPSIIALLIKNGAEVNLLNREGNTPLHLAVDAPHNCTAVITSLIKNGAEVNVPNKEGNTPLHLAAAALHDRTAVITSLIKNGAEVNVPNKEGNTPLRLAAHSINKGNLAYLLLNRTLFADKAQKEEQNKNSDYLINHWKSFFSTELSVINDAELTNSIVNREEEFLNPDIIKKVSDLSIFLSPDNHSREGDDINEDDDDMNDAFIFGQ